MTELIYRGRFAPSPTGPLHFGSLVCAVASYLQAKAHGGEWLVRMEDIDPPREPPGAAADILHTLEIYALHWDRPVLFQSTRSDAYEDALSFLRQSNFTYACTCSRKQIQEATASGAHTLYPENCRERHLIPAGVHAIRVKTEFAHIGIQDAVQGVFSQNIRAQVGDFVVKRADGFYAYQLAVVVDDAEQNITEVVRGSDLLDNTPRQIFLQQLLNYSRPRYAHIPIATTNGEKMSKQTKAPPVADRDPVETAVQVLQFLSQPIPEQWRYATIEELWQWAIPRWSLETVPKVFSREHAPAA